jgi:hypothetical protein
MPWGNIPGPAGCTRIALSAGLGSAFGWLMFNATAHFLASPLHDAINELASIAIVGIGVVKFIEPLIERLSIKLGASAAPVVGHGGTSRFAGIATIFVLVVASLGHGLLHAFVQINSIAALNLLLTSLVAPAWITYWWSWAVHYSRWASACGAIFGAIWGSSTVLLLLFLRVATGELPASLHVDQESFWRAVFLNLTFYGVLGFAGGLAIDRGRGLRPVRWISIALVAAIVLHHLLRLLPFTSWLPFGWLGLTSDLSRVLGWSLGLLIVSNEANALLSRRTVQVRSPDIASPRN